LASGRSPSVKAQGSTEPAQSSLKRAVRKPMQQLVAAAKSAARTDKNPHVRLSALGVLAKYLPQHSEISSVIQDVAQNDPEESIRLEAKRLVAAPTP